MLSIRIKKKEYVIGFWWQILEGKGRKQLFEKARAVAEDFKDRKYNCLVPRKQQYGLGSCEGDKIKRLPSLACALVERSTDTWIGMFCLADDIWWVCAVSKKTIVAEGDQFFSSRTEAQAHLNSLKSMSSWNKDNEYICETAEASLSHFEGLLKPSERVQPLNPEHSNLKLIIGAVILISACVGWYMWDSHQQDLREAEQRRIAREARQKELQKQEAVQEDPEQLFAMVWKNTPLPSAFAHEFLHAVRNSEPYTLGWKLNSIVRDVDGIYMAWLHQEGADFTNRPAIEEINSSLGAKPELADLTINYPEAEKRPEQALIKKGVATARLYELTRTLGAKLNLTWQTPETKKLDNKILKKAVAVTAPWIKGEWKLSALPVGVTIEDALFTAMDSIPCLVLSKIDFTNNQCTLEGQIYASY
ncbi:type 4b pilus protein PilO2 [Maridesulfovibrio sp.]|uniref:type 4b pilus protein PilO2 n=1 Tax=Maridesulfovibrio sp. TaxID=2795000 RepID=UPI0039F060BC